jgi:hypothetical protein
MVEDTPNGVLLKAAPPFAPTGPENVFGSLPPRGSQRRLKRWRPASSLKPSGDMLVMDSAVERRWRAAEASALNTLSNQEQKNEG